MPKSGRKRQGEGRSAHPGRSRQSQKPGLPKGRLLPQTPRAWPWLMVKTMAKWGGSLSFFCQRKRTPSVLEITTKFTRVVHSMSGEGGRGVSLVSKMVGMFGGATTQDTMI